MHILLIKLKKKNILDPSACEVTDKHYHILLYRINLALVGFELTTLVVICSDYTGSCKSSYHTITTTTTIMTILKSSLTKYYHNIIEGQYVNFYVFYTVENPICTHAAAFTGTKNSLGTLFISGRINKYASRKQSTTIDVSKII